MQRIYAGVGLAAAILLAVLPAFAQSAIVQYSNAKAPAAQTPPVLKVVLPLNVRMEFVWVPDTNAPSGPLEAKGPTGANAAPTAGGFWMGRYEVTQDQYETIMGENPSRLKEPRMPAHGVSWDNAVQFCCRLSACISTQNLSAVVVDIPSEREWLYAARLSGRQYDGVAPDIGLEKVAVFRANSSGKPSHVGLKGPNTLGIYDMQGNVYEWVKDPYRQDKYARIPESGAVRPLHGDYRICHGGSWGNDPEQCAIEYRNIFRPGETSDLVGFRVVLRPALNSHAP